MRTMRESHQTDMERLGEELKQVRAKLEQRNREFEELEKAYERKQAEMDAEAARLRDEIAQGRESSSPVDRVKSLEAEVEDYKSRLERQLDAFNTIRGELTAVRERQFQSEQRLEREKRELETVVQRLQAEYKSHLDRLWKEREDREDILDNGRTALDEAQMKLMMNGFSPVSETGFDWQNDESQDGAIDEELVAAHAPRRIPGVGKLPPRQKPAFFEFLETPRCSGCLSEVIDI
ncbi:hypothetical protein BX666DRAFT_1345670 [Dichotomocladium elegans]|nr:hypothetical protein BX666DRAFT_1345670 [Dichotomocladium elegans]